VRTFVITHGYAATLSDRIERSGEISSIIGG
jgi:Ni,Fe-hydrogenase I cytochrome b subunit